MLRTYYQTKDLTMSWLSKLFKQDDSLLPLAYQWGEERALMVLESFIFCQAIYPELSKKELYYLTIQKTFECTENEARRIVDDAADAAEGKIGFGLKLPSVPGPFGLHNIVKYILIGEEHERFGFKGFPHRRGMAKAFDAVDDVISSEV